MPDEVYRVEVIGNQVGQFRENVMHFKAAGITAGDPFDTANALVNAWDSNFKAPWLDCVPDDYALDAIKASRVLPLSGTYAMLDYAPLSETGTGSSGAVSEQLCPCVTLIPPMGVKSAGKVFMPSVAKIYINANAYAAAYLTRINTLFTALQAGISFLGGTLELCIFSRKLQSASIITSFHLSPVLGYQRRRARPIGA